MTGLRGPLRANFVAVGADDERGTAAIWTSPDTVTWTRVPLDRDATADVVLTGVTTAGALMVAVGEVPGNDQFNAVILTSIDGVTWTRIPHEESLFGSASGEAGWAQFGCCGASIWEAIGGPEGLVAVGQRELQAAVWVSPFP